MKISISARQKQILDYLARNKSASVQNIVEYLVTQNLADVSWPTINRDVGELTEIEFIDREGAEPSTKYSLTAEAKLLTLIQPKEYFNRPAEDRNSYSGFNWQIFHLLSTVDLFNESENTKLKQLVTEYTEQKNQLSDTLIKKDIERVTIELSWNHWNDL